MQPILVRSLASVSLLAGAIIICTASSDSSAATAASAAVPAKDAAAGPGRGVHADATPSSDRVNQLAAAAVLGALAQAPLQAIEPTLASADNKAQVAKTGSLFSRHAPVEILMIGDSMSVSGFGEALQSYLFRQYGASRVALYASCGSSPEHWLRSEPSYFTKCGYREQTPLRKVYYDFENHRPPPPTATPKLENLLELHQPNILIVQLGTNWMDALETTKNFSAEHSHYAVILNRFAEAVRNASKPVKVVWITPPDASRYSQEVKRNVDLLIRNAAKTYDFDIINSSSITHYIPGKSGGDGVHYKNEEAFAWAAGVQKQLAVKLQ